MKDALSNDLIIGQNYGYSRVDNGITTIKIGKLVKINEKLVSLEVVESKRGVYKNDSEDKRYTNRIVSVKANGLFPVYVKDLSSTETIHTMKDLLETYSKTVHSIFKKFGDENSYGEIDIKTNVTWTSIQDEEVRWIENDEIYCNETMHSSPYLYENFVMYWVDNGCGDRFYQVFDNNLRNDSVEFWESYD